MILTSVSTVLLILASSIEASPSSMPSNKTFSELLDSFIAVEMNRTNATKTAEEVAANRKSKATLKFLKDVGYANYVLENIRRYFVAGEMWLDFVEGESQLPKETVLLRVKRKMCQRTC
nr:PREDICTED: uncharacterized protein LOC109040358 [Bemisia tabaci]